LQRLQSIHPNPDTKRNPMRLATTSIALAILIGSPAAAQAGRYELVPEPDVRQTSSTTGIPGNSVDRAINQ
jgi:hypothetical protein